MIIARYNSMGGGKPVEKLFILINRINKNTGFYEFRLISHGHFNTVFTDLSTVLHNTLCLLIFLFFNSMHTLFLYFF